jgi:hypothetical protein
MTLALILVAVVAAVGFAGIGLTVGASGSSAATSQASGPIQVTYGGSPASKVALYAIIAAVILVGLVIWMKRK